ncbi:MAG: GIY-YIG nuclease family protein [Sandaracinaceae bacterium]
MPATAPASTCLALAPVLILDCQATGAAPGQGHLLEVGWQALGPSPGPVEASLVRLPRGARVPRKVAELTGLRDADLRHAPRAQEVWARLLEAAAAAFGLGPATAVVHHAALEVRFLTDLAARTGTPFPFTVVDTHRIARRLLPDLPRCGLRALAGFLGHPVGPERRAAQHVRATEAIWRCLLEALLARGVRTRAELERWLGERARPPAGAARSWPMPRARRLAAPEEPGVYRFLRSDGSVLYVGKAASLKRRVNGHFRRRRRIDERALEMLTQARSLDVTVTATETEAALLEADEIKRLTPAYNVQLRDGSVAFLDAALREAVPDADRAHPVGPVRDPDVLLVVPRLVAAMRGGPGPVLAVGGRWAPPAPIEADGLAELRRRHGPIDTLDAALGLARRLGPPPLADEEGSDGRAEGWTPEEVCASLEDRLREALLALRRARWLLRLVEASVAWRERTSRRLLEVRRAQVAGVRWLEDGEPVPPPPGAGARAAGRRAALATRAPYDRLRILTTELRRLAAAGASPEVHLGRRAVVRGPALARLLRSV